MYGVDGLGVDPKLVAALCLGLALYSQEIPGAAAVAGGQPPPKIFAGAAALGV